MTVPERGILPGFAVIEGTNLAGKLVVSRDENGVSLSDIDDWPDTLWVPAAQIPAVITWLTQQWAEHNKARMQEKR